jgi:hypothetical protein
MINNLYIALVLATFCACKKPKEAIENEAINPEQVVIYDYAMNGLPSNNAFQNNNAKGGVLQSNLLEEASGLAMSRNNTKILWSHNDRGHANQVFLVGNMGEDYGYFQLSGVGNRDWEDICLGPGKETNKTYVYVGEIGDNNGVHPSIFIYYFEEPDLTNETQYAARIIAADKITSVEYTYPDGPKDAETLMIDPWTNDLYIVSKRTAQSILYRAKYPHTGGELEKLAVFPFNWAVGGDISADGTKIAIKDNYNIYFWERDQGQSIVDAMRVAPQKLPYIVEPQGESIAWSLDGNEYFTLSEASPGITTELYYYTK